MARYQTKTRLSPHDLLAALGLEDNCGSAVVGGGELVLQDDIVFESGQAAGQLSSVKQALLAGGMIGGADMSTLRAFIDNSTPTAAQGAVALKALIRVLRKTLD